MAGGAGTRDFFISRTGADADVAIVVDKVLRDAGYTTWLQDKDFGPASFMARMAEGWSVGGRLICLLSDKYQRSEHCRKEYEVALAADPRNLKERVIVLRIGECSPIEHLADLAYIDLVPHLNDAEAFAKVVRGAVDRRAPEADFAGLYARAPKQILHDKVWHPVAGFAGRETELDALDAALWKRTGRAALTDTGAMPAALAPAARPNTTGATVAARGMGGVGKTVLAQQYAWANKDRYHGVWWLRADTTDNLLTDLVALGVRLLGPSLGDMEPAHAARVVLDHIGQTREARPWLLVYDNVETPEAIRTLTPGDHAHVLITTRHADWYGEAEELPLDVFSAELAVAFLMERANGSATDPEGTRRDAALLAEDLGRLPLALAIARAQARGNHWTFAQYREHIADMMARKPTRAVDYPHSVLVTFDSALDAVLPRAAEAGQLMGLCAFLAADRIPLSLFGPDVMGAVDLGDAVHALSEASLLTRDMLADGTRVVSVHRLVQRVMRVRLERMGELANGAARAVEIVDQAFRMPVYVADIPAATRLAPHAAEVLGHAAGDDGNAWHLAVELGDWQRSRGERKEARASFERALRIAEAREAAAADEPFHKQEIAASLERIADVLLEEGNRDAALVNYRKALALREKLVADDPAQPGLQRDVSISLERIADVLREEGNRTGALAYYQRALAIAGKLAADDPGQPQLQRDVSISLNKIADVLREEGNRDAALVNYRKALVLREKLAAGDPAQPGLQRDVSVSLNKIADVLREEGNRTGALANYQKALDIREKLAADDPGQPRLQRNVSISYERIADVLHEEGNRDAALQNYQSCLTISQKLAEDDPGRPQYQQDVSRYLDRIADVLREEGNRTGALANYQKALAIREKLAVDDPAQPQLQTDLVVSYVRLAEMEVEPRENWQRAQAVLTRLAGAGLLTHAQGQWLGIVEAKLAELDHGAQQASLPTPVPSIAGEGGVPFVPPRRRSILDWLWRQG